jgi:hypothetical protein
LPKWLGVRRQYKTNYAKMAIHRARSIKGHKPCKRWRKRGRNPGVVVLVIYIKSSAIDIVKDNSLQHGISRDTAIAFEKRIAID